ncbi:MAG: aspartate-semialdehyde dehydrogenase, partial [Thermoleophilia bacterium]|nr:aspartate-semialdehyde dehydrogenase [Thermoleophilia bacterium]
DLEVVVEDLESADPTGLDVALFSAGATRALDHAQRFADAGCVVIDNSSAFRMYDEIPLVVPEVNPEAARAHNGIIANPNCSTIQLVVALKPLHDAATIERLVVTTFQSVSGTGQAAMIELSDQAAAALDAREPAASIYPHQIAFNVLPQCDSFDDAGNTKEELKLVNESRKILGAAALRVSATCVRVPVFVAHAESVNLEFARELSADAARELLAAAPGVIVHDDPARGLYPMPLTAHGHDEVFVGRIRNDDSVTNGLSLFVVADNLRKGAATNTVQILELLLEQGTLRVPSAAASESITAQN